MSFKVKCYIEGCPLAPVFKCNCAGNIYTCQNHCFGHMQNSCSGKLEPYVQQTSHTGQKISTAPISDTLSKFEMLHSTDLISSLFPGEAAVYQCKMCGKLVPKSGVKEHVCERSEICVLNVTFARKCYNKYECLQCRQLVHSTFIYPHADLHNKPMNERISPEEITYLASLIIKNEILPKNPGDKPEIPEKSAGGKPSVKAQAMPCLNAPFAFSGEMPVKRSRQETINLDSDSS